MAKPFNKYLYYENSVQTPEEHVRIFDRMFHEIRGRIPMNLKEDFCGTFMISCEWVRSHPKRMSLGVDLDPEPIAYGRKNAYLRLTPAEKKRVKILKEDVCTPIKSAKADVIGAGNFSFNIFKTKEQMVRYFKAAHQTLGKDGIFVLEMAGGPGFIAKGKEQKTYTVKSIGKYMYYWDQKSFDPITHEGTYAIHFREPNGNLKRDVFVYDWRIWTIPELRDMMKDAGFQDTKVYWEAADKKGDGTGDYVQTAKGDNAFAWIAFVVGLK